MDQEQWRFLLSPDGQELLAETADPPLTEANHLQAASHLRQRIDPHLAQAVIETVWLRQRAQNKFTRAGNMYFTRPALEQASSETVALYRAQRYVQAGFHKVADLGCGIGGDALALAAGAHVTGIDRDSMRLAMAQENVRAYGHARRFEPMLANLETLPPADAEALFFDPARRDQHGRRIKSVKNYLPPLQLVDHWREAIPHAGVKISPGVDYEEIPSGAEVEFISVSGAVKEAVLWYGDLRRGQGSQATLLPGEQAISALDYPGADRPPQLPAAYLYEPDGAVIRAHLVQPLARHLDAAPIDETIAYLTANRQIDTPFARVFAIEDWFPFQLKRLRRYLREHDVGQVTIKKRGSPLEPDALQSQLRLQGRQHKILFLTHVLGKPAVLIGREL